MLQALVGGFFMLILGVFVYALIQELSGGFIPNSEAIDDTEPRPDTSPSLSYYATGGTSGGAGYSGGGDGGGGGGGGGASGDGGGGGGGGSW